jgi:hypothetical protein
MPTTSGAVVGAEQSEKALLSEASGAAKPSSGKGSRPRKQRPKKQVTVRVDEALVNVALKRATSMGLTLTDAFEDGLWDWLQRDPPPMATMQGRLVWNVLPLNLQRLTLRFWSFVTAERRELGEEICRKYIVDMLQRIENEAAVIDGLQRLVSASGGPPIDKDAQRLL